jgi:hypothetical protein
MVRELMEVEGSTSVVQDGRLVEVERSMAIGFRFHQHRQPIKRKASVVEW